MRLLRLLILVPLALAFAIASATMFLLIGGIMEPAGQQLVIGLADAIVDAFEESLVREVAPDFPLPLAWGLWRASLAILVAPVACVGIAGEVFRVSSYIHYAGLTGLVTALMPWLARTRLETSGRGLEAGLDAAELRITALLFLTGALAGSVYWLVAGRSAGPDRLPAS